MTIGQDRNGVAWQCSNCKWWDPPPNIEKLTGLCRYNPPVLLTGSIRWPWPSTAAEDWCSEFMADGGARAKARTEFKAFDASIKDGV